MSSIPSEVVHRFAHKHNVELLEASHIFDQLEDFLDTASKTAMSPPATVDEAWHEFILHTKSYSEYCTHRYGRFIHHLPNSSSCCDTNCSTGDVRLLLNVRPLPGVDDCSSDCSSDDSDD